MKFVKKKKKMNINKADTYKKSIRNSFSFLIFSFITLYKNRSNIFSWNTMFDFLWNIIHDFLKLLFYPRNGFFLTIKQQKFTDQFTEDPSIVGPSTVGPSILESLTILDQVCKCLSLDEKTLAMLGEIIWNLEAIRLSQKKANMYYRFFLITKGNTLLT